MDVSIVILTYNRPDDLAATVADIRHLADKKIQILVVDNASSISASEVLKDVSGVEVIRLDENRGVAGRNEGIQVSQGNIVVCLDDDVSGLRADHIAVIRENFEADPSLGGLCFRVHDAKTDELMNWVHHRDVEKYSNRSFETYEITEGAVALRRSAAISAGMYPEEFFISHEGPDLALRMMNDGFRITYTPHVVVRHSHSDVARTSWRNYYYDTRNTFLLAGRNLPFWFGAKYVVQQTAAVFLFALRDKYLSWWWKGLRDGVAEMLRTKDRRVVSTEVIARIRSIKKDEESLLRRLRRFLSGHEIGR